MNRLPTSVSLCIRLKDKPVGYRFSEMMLGEKRLIHQWIQTGHIKKVRGGGFEIVKKIEPIMYIQKIHDYIMGRTSFTTMDIINAVGCSRDTVIRYIHYYGSYYNLESDKLWFRRV